MENIEDVHCLAAIEAVLNANIELISISVGEAIREVEYGKPDTLGLDTTPENAIVTSLANFDTESIVITEEAGKVGETVPRGRFDLQRPTFYLSDPTDRSAQFYEFLLDEDGEKRVGEVLNHTDARNKWAARFGSPSSITGPCSAVTCVRYGVPIATAIVNFLTQELFVASRFGVLRMDIPPNQDPSCFTLESLRSNGRPIYFPVSARRGDATHNFVTFLGKTGYKENFQNNDILTPKDAVKFCQYCKPGGPTRVLYLSDVQPVEHPMGFVLANGEKIGEWVHWIPFIRFGRSQGDSSRGAPLVMHEIHQERPWTKDGILMSTNPLYSIFVPEDDGSGNMVIDVAKLHTVPNPSRFRSTLFVANRANGWANGLMVSRKFRQIMFGPPRGSR